MLGRYGEGQSAPQELLDRRQIYAVGLAIATMAVGLVVQFAGPAHHRLVHDAFYLIGVLLLGGPIIAGAVRGLWHGHTNVDELVALAIVASTLTGHVLEADIVALLMVLGSLFEQRASLRARRAIEQLLKLAPKEATLVHDDGREETVSADHLKPRDRVIVRTGQRVPADGTVEIGGANFDQSAVTGESVPVYRQINDPVFAGALALDGSATIRVTRTGEDSTVGQIIKIVRDAEHYQAPAMRIADRWARYYTPLIVVVSSLTLIGWWLVHRGQTGAWTNAWTAAVAVLVVGCPCTIVLATPTAIIAAMGRAAKLGVLIKSGRVLERASQVDTLIFDKTGTLTSGKHQVVAAVPADDLKGMNDVVGLCPAMEHSILKLHDPERVQNFGQLPPSPRPGERAGERAGGTLDPLVTAAHSFGSASGPSPQPSPRDGEREKEKRHLIALAAAVEHGSNHPFAKAIREHAEAMQIEFTPADDVREIPGIGVEGRVGGVPIVVGRPEFVAHNIHNACAVPGTMIRPIQRYSVIAVEAGGKYAGLLLLRDTMREAAEAVVEDLRDAGLTNLAVLSGDHRGAVKLVADQLRLDHAYSGLMPADKARQVKALREQGHVVAFVGDGINDAPALATADIGIAMGGTGTDLALESADIVLLNDRIELLGTLFDLARRVRKTIHANLAIGLTLNITALALASAGILSPMWGALVHNLGSVFVVSNSARFAAFGRAARRRFLSTQSANDRAARQAA